MKYNKLFPILAVAVIFSLLMIAIPATPVLAVENITLSATSGPVGTPLTVLGTGFTTAGSGYVWFDTDNDSVRDSGEPYLSATVAGGIFSATGTLTVPTVPRTTIPYNVRADVPSGAPIEAVASFEVTPQIKLNGSLSATGYVGDTVTVTGDGFTANAAGGYIWFDTDADYVKDTGEPYLSATTNASGVLAASGTIAVPAVPKGTYYVRAEVPYDATPDVPDASASFAVSPKITISATSGGVGDTVTVSGAGFAATSAITIYFDTTSEGTATTNDSGSFPSTTLTVPSTSQGSHTIKAQDASANYATATFIVSAKITIDPSSGGSGTKVTVNGTGFGASKTVTIKYNAVVVTTTPSTVTTGATGSFTASFTAPASLAGTYVVEATTDGITASANFVSTTDATIDTVTSEADPGYVGMELTITGTGFKPNATVTIKYATAEVVLDTVPTDVNGDFEVEITIPPSEAGPHTIKVTDGIITKTFAFYMESTPPEAPSLLLPLTGDKLKDWKFDWGNVEDAEGSDPVTYDLQVASDADFENILLEETGLTTSDYTLLKAERLEKTSKEEPYYWQVRAIDAASNVGDWSDAGTFYVGFAFEFTGWVMWVTMGVIALVFFLIGLWVGKRRGGGYY